MWEKSDEEKKSSVLNDWQLQNSHGIEDEEKSENERKK